MESENFAEDNLGEKLVGEFFDGQISKFCSFPSPRTKGNAEIADVAVWHNRRLFLIEVKSRDTARATTSSKSWATDRIKDALAQIRRNYSRCIAGETINLHNDFFHVEFDPEGIGSYVGLVILAFDGECKLSPTAAIPNLYDGELPIHVFTWDDLQSLREEIDTVPDLAYYLQDRYRYVRQHDIPLGVEREVIAHYKLHNNRLPADPINFRQTSLWEEYRKTRADAIRRRTVHNKNSLIIDELEACFSDARRMHGSLPIGLQFAWEVGSLARRHRASIGEKLHNVRSDFERGKHSRQFGLLNPASENWHVYFFYDNAELDIKKQLRKLLRLKCIKESHLNGFEYAVYGFAFQVSRTHQLRLRLAAADVVGADAVKGFSDDERRESLNVWGPQRHTSIVPIREFPDS